MAYFSKKTDKVNIQNAQVYIRLFNTKDKKLYTTKISLRKLFPDNIFNLNKFNLNISSKSLKSKQFKHNLISLGCFTLKDNKIHVSPVDLNDIIIILQRNFRNYTNKKIKGIIDDDYEKLVNFITADNKLLVTILGPKNYDPVKILLFKIYCFETKTQIKKLVGIKEIYPLKDEIEKYKIENNFRFLIGNIWINIDSIYLVNGDLVFQTDKLLLQKTKPNEINLRNGKSKSATDNKSTGSKTNGKIIEVHDTISFMSNNSQGDAEYIDEDLEFISVRSIHTASIDKDSVFNDSINENEYWLY